MINVCRMDSPLGPIWLAGDATGLTQINLGQAPMPPSAASVPSPSPLLALAVAQLQAYFRGALREFDLPLTAQGTPFQQQVWTALCSIDYGQTASYGAIAERIGRAGSARAVGMANGRNPLPIVVPCHRVIGASGQLTGYAGGLPRKQWLLQHEAQHATGLNLPATRRIAL